MEENKEKKTITLSLSTGVSLIIIIMLSVVILAMAYFYNFKDIKGNKQNQPENNQVANATPTQSVTPTEEIQPTKEEVSKFTNEQVKESIEYYLKMVGTMQGEPSALVELLGWNINTEKSYETGAGNRYYETKVKYSDFLDKVYDHVSEGVFIKNINLTFGVICFQEGSDGFLQVAAVGATGMGFEVESVEEKGDNTYIANFRSIRI